MLLDRSMVKEKLGLDMDRDFRQRARGVRMAGLWAAERLGLNDTEQSFYARSVVEADFEEAGDDDVIRRLVRDLTPVGINEAEIRAQLTRCLAEAHGTWGA